MREVSTRLGIRNSISWHSETSLSGEDVSVFSWDKDKEMGWQRRKADM
jgi:hypothetical protein